MSAGASTTRYYLSTDTAKGNGDVLLTGSRMVGILGASGFSTGAATVTVPSATAPGVYRVFACADDLKVVKELSEINNCTIAATSVTVNP